MKFTKIVLLSVGLSVCLANTAWAAKSQGNDNWQYQGKHGPQAWGQLDAQYAACSQGKEQSPINIEKTIPVQSSDNAIVPHYQATPYELSLNKHNLNITFPQAGQQEYVNFAGVNYYLQGIHFHAPSEHQIKGKSFPLAAHLVHKNSEGKLLVIGVLMDQGKANSFLTTLLTNPFPSMGQTIDIKQAQLNPADLLPKDDSVYFYTGSLTTPPCSENVSWLVMQNPMSVSAQQLEFFHKRVTDNNARPVQPANGRTPMATVASSTQSNSHPTE